MTQYSKAFSLYTKDLSDLRFSPLSASEERKLIIQTKSENEQEAREAFNKIVEAHLRFVVYFVGKYNFSSSIDIMDVIQEATMGLMEGIKRFDPFKYDCRVFTFCSWWIRFYINTFLGRSQKLETVSIDETGIDMGEPISDTTYVTIFEELSKSWESKLSPVEIAVITLTYGLNPPYDSKPLQEVSSVLHINLEQVRQIKIKALNKLSNIIRKRELI